MKNMKKLTALLLAGAMTLALAACGNSNPPASNGGTSQPNTQGSSSSKQDTPTPPPVDDANLTPTQMINKEAAGMTLE